MNEIAVLLNENSEVSSPEDTSNILVFEKQDIRWEIINDIPFKPDFTRDITSVRKDLKQLASELEQCKIMVGKCISGLAYQVFDSMGFAIFELKKFSMAGLDKILFDVQSAAQKKDVENNLYPTETEVPGIYFFNLIAAQKQNPDVSSKKMLQTFLEHTRFLRLDVICSHLPPWIEKMAENKIIEVETNRISSEKMKISIAKNEC